LTAPASAPSRREDRRAHPGWMRRSGRSDSVRVRRASLGIPGPARKPGATKRGWTRRAAPGGAPPVAALVRALTPK